jgi:hypothetical protein
VVRKFFWWFLVIILGGISLSGRFSVKQFPGEEFPILLNIRSDHKAIDAPTIAGTWVDVTSPTRKALFDIDMVNEELGWAVGAGGIILKYSDGQWQEVPSPTSSDLVALDMRNSTEGWAVGNNPITLLHYTEEGWQTYDDPVLTRHYRENGTFKVIPTQANTKRYDIELFGDTQGIVVGGQLTVNNWATIFALNESEEWEFIIDRKQPFALLGLSLLEDGQGWGVGDHVIIKFGESASLDPQPIPHEVPATLTAVSTIDNQQAWAVGTNGHLAHYTNGRWQMYSTTNQLSFTNVEMLGSDRGWAVGTSGAIVYYRDGIWYLYSSSLGNMLDPTTFTAIDMISEEDGWIVGLYGKILHFQAQQLNR